jgi:hypothetical protein
MPISLSIQYSLSRVPSRVFLASGKRAFGLAPARDFLLTGKREVDTELASILGRIILITFTQCSEESLCLFRYSNITYRLSDFFNINPFVIFIRRHHIRILEQPIQRRLFTATIDTQI